ncbi:hypothetical protein [Nocardia flavorosea]|uniref:Uncharacterized protein n=1 Tax=Nocardia flavorosea TaxID=53429 RepID=A0A846YU57_9NOCA|nr:hypothetical protein [Nocardia flavorosea]NKY60792.1 hypothetical protein [Nocardia flavorosea]
MPREYARFQLSMWEDDDFLNLTPPAQHLYFVLATDPEMSYCGRVDWRPTRLRVRAAGWTPERIESAAAELEEARFVLFDPDTEEALVRALIRSDELLRNPKMGISVVRAYGAVASRTLRAAVVTEVKRAHAEHPEYSSFSSPISGEHLARLMTRPDLEEHGYTNRITNHIGNHIGNRIGNAEPVENTNRIGNAIGNPIGNADRSVSYLHTADRIQQTYIPHTARAADPGEPDAPPPAQTSRQRRREPAPIPEEWAPTDTHRHKAGRMGVDLEHEADQFRNHALANGRLQVDWNAAFHTWLGKARPRPATHATPGPPATAGDRKRADLNATFDELNRQVAHQRPLMQVIDAEPAQPAIDFTDWSATA